jgi:hypothetical protein
MGGRRADAGCLISSRCCTAGRVRNIGRSRGPRGSRVVVTLSVWRAGRSVYSRAWATRELGASLKECGASLVRSQLIRQSAAGCFARWLRRVPSRQTSDVGQSGAAASERLAALLRRRSHAVQRIEPISCPRRNQSFDPGPEYRRRSSLLGFPLIYNRFAGRSNLVGKLRLRQPESPPDAYQYVSAIWRDVFLFRRPWLRCCTRIRLPVVSLHERSPGRHRRPWDGIPKHDAVHVRHLEATVSRRCTQCADVDVELRGQFRQRPQPMRVVRCGHFSGSVQPGGRDDAPARVPGAIRLH